MSWRDHLTPSERQQLETIELRLDELNTERRAIFEAGLQIGRVWGEY